MPHINLPQSHQPSVYIYQVRQSRHSLENRTSLAAALEIGLTTITQKWALRWERGDEVSAALRMGQQCVCLSHSREPGPATKLQG